MRRKAPNKGKGFWFDKAAADRACEFFPIYLRHIDGAKYAEPFNLEGWQREIIRTVFGWKRPDGTRRYRTVYLFLPRKNGKTTLISGLANYLLTADGEPGAQVYSAAGDREQASIMFESAKSMARLSPALWKRLKPFKRSIVYEKTMSTYKVLSADAKLKHGLNASAILFDELHVQKNRELWDTLKTSTGARRQPLTFAITTAGYDKNSICWEVHEYALAVKKGTIQDDSFLPIIYCADPEDDWTDPKVWKKANPNLGVSISESYLKEQCTMAQNNPAFENTFKRLHLNIWTSQDQKALSIETWDASGDAGGDVEEQSLLGRKCYGGLDLASRTDIAALAYDFTFPDGSHKSLFRFFVPEERIKGQSEKMLQDYEFWEKEGYLIKTAGNVIDHRQILKVVREDMAKFQIMEMAFDRWGATHLVQDLEDDGLTMVPFGQGFASMGLPTKEFLVLTTDKKIHHGNNPVMRWMVDNLVLKSDPAGNLKPDKSKAQKKIDGVVAYIMALGRSILAPPPAEDGQTEDVRGLIQI